ncbi:ACP phosphodiesterase [Vibrio maerlii]|uniref:acyl carrier protein phosphodiesterase n=1 Tax=Vibrio maerlii TaxID=2231648 RepID=UPI000E3C433A|nr:ACP phosphodiesterase [Vibrio maerlii]
MNFLAHLHIADHSQSHLLGNLLGDFVKGDPSDKYPADIVQGIQLHRFVDRYTDTHNLVTSLKPLFPDRLRRFSPIALDMFWDHCLANEWQSFHTQPLTCFLESCESQLNKDLSRFDSEAIPQRYRRVHHFMWAEQWLLSYKDMENIAYALERMSMRSDRMGPLADCADSLVNHYQTLREAFLDLYPQVLAESRLMAAQLR